MSTDIRDITDTMEEIAFGAAETAAEVAGNPIGSVRRQVKSFERKGTPTARKLNRRVNARIDAATEPARDAFKLISKTAAMVADELVPEKVVLRSLRQMKSQAKRPDAIGKMAKRTLRLFNKSFKTVARVATRFESASEIAPASRTAAKPATTRRRAARSRRRAA